MGEKLEEIPIQADTGGVNILSIFLVQGKPYVRVAVDGQTVTLGYRKMKLIVGVYVSNGVLPTWRLIQILNKDLGKWGQKKARKVYKEVVKYGFVQQVWINKRKSVLKLTEKGYALIQQLPNAVLNYYLDEVLKS